MTAVDPIRRPYSTAAIAPLVVAINQGLTYVRIKSSILKKAQTPRTLALSRVPVTHNRRTSVFLLVDRCSGLSPIQWCIKGLLQGESNP